MPRRLAGLSVSTFINYGVNPSSHPRTPDLVTKPNGTLPLVYF